MPPFWMAGVRFLIAGLVMAVWARTAEHDFPRTAATWGWAILSGWLILGIAVGLMFWAEQHIDSGLAALLASLAPLFMAFWGSVGSEGDRLSMGLVGGLLLGIVGVAILVDPQWAVSQGSTPLLAVAAIVVVGAQAWTGGSVLAKRKLKHVSPLATAAVHSLTAGIFLLLFDLVIRGGRIPDAAVESWISLAYLTIFGSIVAYSAYVYLVTHMAPAKAGTYGYLNPIIAVLLGWLILGEQITWRIMAGGGVILSGLFVVRRVQLVPRRAPQPPDPEGDRPA
jgi:drug/metabolite transporter (DMT)-like permease